MGLSRLRAVLAFSTVTLVLSMTLFVGQVLNWSNIDVLSVGVLVTIAGSYTAYRYLRERGLFWGKISCASSLRTSGESSPCESCSSQGTSCFGNYNDDMAYRIADFEQKELRRMFSSPFVVQMAVVLGWCFLQLVALSTHIASTWIFGDASFMLSFAALLGFSVVRVYGLRLSKMQLR